MTTDFQSYAQQVIRNAKALCEAFAAKGYTLVTGGTDNHICLLDLRPKGIDAARIEGYFLLDI
jgi:glycine hydroxymethyltransferase